jgi:hypothetical protein
VNCTKGLVGYSILWLGVLFGLPKDAVANSADLSKLDTVDSTAHQPDSSFSSNRDRPIHALTVAAIAPAETATPSLERQTLAALPLKATVVAAKDVPSAPYPESPALPSNYPPDTTSDGESPVTSEDESTTGQDDLTEPGDPELGILRLRERELATEQRNETETIFLVGGVNYLRSNNILLDDFDPVNDQLVSAGASLLAIPSLGPRTQLVAAINGNVTRYSRLSDLDYNNFGFQVGVQQTLLPNTYGEISLSNQQFFDSDSGDRFLNDYSTWLTLSRRDQLTTRLTLNSFYQLRLSFTDPSDRSRVGNALGASFNYELPLNFGVGLDYQFILTDFTRQDRNDAYHQITAELSYNLSPNSRASIFGGFSFGESSDPDINFNSSIFGISINANLSLF